MDGTCIAGGGLRIGHLTGQFDDFKGNLTPSLVILLGGVSLVEVAIVSLFLLLFPRL